MNELDDRTFADVTVVMPAKDRADLIGRALASVSAQTLRPRETIVVDDGSVDGTGDVARQHGARATGRWRAGSRAIRGGRTSACGP